jgi:hypothetical protein
MYLFIDQTRVGKLSEEDGKGRKTGIALDDSDYNESSQPCIRS